MPTLKTKHRLMLQFSAYFFLFLLLLTVLFIVLFRVLFVSGIKRDLTREIGEVVGTHIEVDSLGIVFKKDKNKETLRQDLIDDGISALFLDKDKGILRKYGQFEFPSTPRPEDLDEVMKLVDESFRTRKVMDVKLIWNNAAFIAYISPIASGSGQYVGSMIVAKQETALVDITGTILVVFGAIGLIGLLGSFVLGYYITNTAFAATHTLTRVIDGIDLDKLDKTVHIPGHPGDEFVELAAKFNGMIKRLRLMSDKQKEFVANASHELKTPLARALSTLEVMLASPTLDRQELALVRDDLFDINLLIERLLLLSRVHEHELPAGTAGLHRVLDKVTKRLTNEIRERSATINSPAADVRLPLPPEYAEIVMANILGNAVKYSPRGGTITVSVEERQGRIALAVTDTGAGMTKDEQEHMFDRFYRGKQAQRFGKGYGIGLSLVRQICESYGIVPSVVSAPHAGTTATLVYPAV